MFRKRIILIATVASALAAVFSALQIMDRIRLVEVITVFVGAFGAGAGTVKAIIDFRQEGKLNSQQSEANESDRSH